MGLPVRGKKADIARRLADALWEQQAVRRAVEQPE